MVKDYPVWMDDNAISMFKNKYSFNGETVSDAFSRVANKLATHMPDVPNLASIFYNLMWDGKLAPATPVYLNVGAVSASGKLRGHAVSCSGGVIGDSIDDYYDSFGEEAKLSQAGYGCSYYLGKIRPRGSLISSSGGEADGQVPVAEMCHQIADKVTQGDNRRGSVALYYEFSSPDLMEGLNKLFELQGEMNVGVNIRDSDIELLKAHDETAIEKLSEILFLRKRIGKPYIMLPDNANRMTTQGIRDSGLEILASNLCTEIMLPSNEFYTFSCVLSSLNLAKWDLMTDDDIKHCIWFLDCVVSEAIENTKNIPKMIKLHNFTKDFRAIGLGTLGWHTYLQDKMIPYESFQASMLIKEIHSRIARVSDAASIELGEKYGVPKFGGGRRNATLTAIAPNLSSAQLAGASQSVEPIIANAYSKATAAGEVFVVNKKLQEVIESKGIEFSKELIRNIAENGGSVQHLEFLTELEKQVFKTAYEMDMEILIMQNELRQEDVDQGISFNIFTSGDTSEEEFVKIHKRIITSKKLKSAYYVRSTKITKTKECVACEA